MQEKEKRITKTDEDRLRPISNDKRENLGAWNVSCKYELVAKGRPARYFGNTRSKLVTSKPPQFKLRDYFEQQLVTSLL